MGGTDVSVDDPAFWSKVGFVAKKASAANLGERKRKAVERMGMGEEWVDDEAEDEAEGATKMLTMLQKVGVRRASELPVLSRQPQFTAADATSFAHGAVLACAAALGAAADSYEIVAEARAAKPKPLAALKRIKERLRDDGRKVLERLTLLHALYRQIESWCSVAQFSHLAGAPAATLDAAAAALAERQPPARRQVRASRRRLGRRARRAAPPRHRHPRMGQL